MQTVDASSDPSVSSLELSASNVRVCRDSAVEGDAKTPSSRFGNGTMALDQPVPPCEKNPETLVETGFTSAASAEVPSWKRILDITCILLSLPLWLPIVLLIALWIKFASPGPIFFRQERVGYRGSRFIILKFRTMKLNVDTRTHEHHLEQLINANVPMPKLDSAGDPRIIAGGRILRATGLDELPQLFNVLNGEMSLVGPRPERPELIRNFKHEIPHYNARHTVKPGITGWAQVNGFRGDTDLAERIRHDLHYVEHWNLLCDLQTMFLTFWKNKNAH